MPSGLRSDVFKEGLVGTYHCYNRTAQQQYLCGKDPLSGNDYTARRLWIVDFERELAKYFAVEVGFHAELANHLHVVLRVRPDIVQTWNDEEVVRRWLSITHLVRSKDGKTFKVKDKRFKKELRNPRKVAEARRKLAHISNFMGSLCEHIARRCNAEAGKSGHFWEGRFEASNLVSLAAKLCCGIYVDLNQIRAGEVQVPEASVHTSAYERIAAWQQRENSGTTDFRPATNLGPEPLASSGVQPPSSCLDEWLCELTLATGRDAPIGTMSPSASGRRASDKGLLPIDREQYFQLLDLSGRMLKEGKGAIPADLPPIMERLKGQGIYLNVDEWHEAVTMFDARLGKVIGDKASLAQRAAQANRKWYRGQRNCGRLFG